MVRTKEFDPDVALERAVELFWERGYEGTSLHDLVERMGIGRRSLYDTFGDKHTLFLAALRRYAARYDEEFVRITAEAPDARRAIRLLFELSVTQGTPLHRGCLLVNTATEATIEDGQADAIVGRRFADMRELVSHLVESGRRDGSITSRGSAAALTSAMYNAWLGLRVRVRAGADPDQLRAELDELITLLG
ncbi:MAG TPA: TetR/AcrR family transcriptional regulator [Pseudonocardia sp.]|jgi:TetR/AcrR family transcriptional repressor of nem operon|nr:TetR/AcrR family transcriptional regulator [Pseudonocardia sp.]